MTSQTTFNSCMHDQMLESNRDDVKLEAMRCVTVMTAKGKLSMPRTLFPHIVKNVSSKNPELKKLIYLYLTNFADQEPDLALLPVATLQKSLKSPNPLLRSSALKALTSMRLNILSAILMATLRNSVNDLSPYVRKTVAHSIIKIYRLDPSLKPDLVEYIERLFNDKNSMVLSSVVAAYDVICPERLDLVQKHYRRFCFILADCNEWGQTLMLKLLVRYILKTCKPSKNDITRSSAEQDPKILLRSAKPLVHSNNSAVVMAVIKLYIAIANHNEVRSTIPRPLIRLLYSHRETQLLVLEMIENLTSLSESSIELMDFGNDHDNDMQPESHSTPDPLTVDEKQEFIDSSIDTGSKDSSAIVSNSLEKVNTDVDEEQLVVRDGYIAINGSGALPETNENSAMSQEMLVNNYESPAEASTGQNIIQCEEIETSVEDGQSSSEDDGEGDESNGNSDEDDQSDTDSDEEDSSEESEDDEDSEGSSDDNINDLKSHVKTKSANKGEGSDSDPDDDKKEFDSNFIDLSANRDPSAYREMFRPYIKSFYIKHTDCTQTKISKLKILTNLSCPVNVSQILKELQAYIAIYVEDHEFISASIHAIGRCAIIVKEVAPTCLNSLTTLLSNNNEHVVSEAIVVLRSQIINKKIKCMAKNARASDTNPETAADKGQPIDQADQEENQTEEESQADDDDKMVSAVIKQVTKLLPTVTAPQARGTILWILAEFCDKNLTAAKCTPNVLRSLAKSFCLEEIFVKLQSLNLASKFLLSLDKEKKIDLYKKISLITNYLFDLANHDTNHDVRDRSRFLEKLLENEEVSVKVLNSTGCRALLETAA